MSTLSLVAYTGDGGTGPFAVPFSYLDKAHVSVSVDGIVAPFTWVNDASVSLAAAAASGAHILIRRTTPSAGPLVDFTDGSILTEADLDVSALQQLYLVQESMDLATTGVALDVDGQLTADGRRIKSLGAPTASADAATKAYVDGITGADQAAAAATSAQAALTAQTAAEAALAATQSAAALKINAATTWTVDNDAATSGTNYATLAEAITAAHRYRIALGASLTITLDADDHAVASDIVIDHPDGARLFITGQTSTAITGLTGATAPGSAADQAANHTTLDADFPSTLDFSGSAQFIVRSQLGGLDHLFLDVSGSTADPGLLIDGGHVTSATRLAASKSTAAQRALEITRGGSLTAAELGLNGGDNGALIQYGASLSLSGRLYCYSSTGNGLVLSHASTAHLDAAAELIGHSGHGLEIRDGSVVAGSLGGDITSTDNGLNGAEMSAGQLSSAGDLTTDDNANYGLHLQTNSCVYIGGALTCDSNSSHGCRVYNGSHLHTLSSFYVRSNGGHGVAVSFNSYVFVTNAGTKNISANGSNAVTVFRGSGAYLTGGTISGGVSPAVNTVGNQSSYIER